MRRKRVTTGVNPWSNAKKNKPRGGDRKMEII